QPDDSPEHDAELYLLGLVAELPLAQQRTGPPAQERQEVQRALGHSPAAVGGSPLVQPVGDEACKAHHGDETQVNADGGHHALLPAAWSWRERPVARRAYPAWPCHPALTADGPSTRSPSACGSR